MTKMLPPELKQAIPIPPEDAGITINVGRDGVWLHFKSAMGLHASFNINQLKGGSGVTSAALMQWCLDRQEQACDIYALLPTEARATPHDYLTREYAMSHAHVQRLTTLVERLAAFVQLPPDDKALLAVDHPRSFAEPNLSAQSAGGIDQELAEPGYQDPPPPDVTA